MDLIEQLNIERACEKLSIDYGRHVDFSEYDAVADLFTVDALLDAGAPLQGQENIRKGFFKRSPKLRSRHILTNISIEVINDSLAKGISYLSLYRHIGEESLSKDVIEFDGPAAIGHYSDEFRRVAGVWKIQSRVLSMAFQNPKFFIRR